MAGRPVYSKKTPVAPDVARLYRYGDFRFPRFTVKELGYEMAEDVYVGVSLDSKGVIIFSKRVSRDKSTWLKYSNVCKSTKQREANTIRPDSPVCVVRFSSAISSYRACPGFYPDSVRHLTPGGLIDCIEFRIGGPKPEWAEKKNYDKDDEYIEITELSLARIVGGCNGRTFTPPDMTLAEARKKIKQRILTRKGFTVWKRRKTRYRKQ